MGLCSAGRWGYRHYQLRVATNKFEQVLAISTVAAIPERHAATHEEMGDSQPIMSELGPRNRSDPAARVQSVVRYQDQAKQPCPIAKSFGTEPGFLVAGAERATAPAAEKKKEMRRTISFGVWGLNMSPLVPRLARSAHVCTCLGCGLPRTSNNRRLHGVNAVASVPGKEIQMAQHDQSAGKSRRPADRP